jgi:Rab-GTPase-TBC domain
MSSSSSSRTRRSDLSYTTPPSPKAFTSFPSFSPEPESPKLKRTPKDARKTSHSDRFAAEFDRDGRPRSRSASSAPAPPSASASTSAFNRTLKGAANLRKALIASLTSSSLPQEEDETPKAVFDHLGIDVSDPLHQATNEQIQRLIDSKGGPIPTVRQFSADVAEGNYRLAQERNSKQTILEENRRVRDENEQLKSVTKELEQRLEDTMNLLKRFVEHHRQHSVSRAEVKVIDSPSGPYLLDAGTGHIITSLKEDSAEPEAVPLERVSSAPSWPTNAPDAAEELKRATAKTKNLASLDLIKIAKRRSLASPRLKSETLELKSSADSGSLPPGLQETKKPRDNAQVDRLGFLFTTNREQRHQEAMMLHAADASESSSLESFPLGDEDFNVVIKTLKLQEDGEYQATTLGTADNSNGELLCYAPVGPALRLVSFGSDGQQKFIDASKPVAQAQTTETIVFTTGETVTQAPASVARPSISGTLTTTEQGSESLKALETLLEKLNEAYDTQQHRRLSEWKTFEQHVRANVRKTHEATDYAMAGIARLCSPSTASPEIMKRFNTMIVLGIPVALRHEVWMEKSGANARKSPGVYQSLLSRGDVDHYTLNDIAADVERTLANNIFFRNGVGRAKLRDVLIAYSWYNPTIGYSQGLNIIAANLLLLVPTAEDAFWLLVAVIDNVLPFEYYHRSGSISGAALETDGNVLLSYVNDLLSNLHKHICLHNVSLTMFTPGWFISAFAACLSGEALYRFWDILFGFCDGRYMFCFALALLKVNRRGLLACQSNEELMVYLGSKMTNAAVSLDVLVREALKFTRDVTVEDLKSRRAQFSVS